MDISAFRRSRISVVVTVILIMGLIFFAFSLFSAMRRSDQVEESQLRLIIDKLQLENRIVFSSIESAVKLEGKKIESGEHEILTRKSDISSLKSRSNLLHHFWNRTVHRLYYNVIGRWTDYVAKSWNDIFYFVVRYLRLFVEN